MLLEESVIKRWIQEGSNCNSINLNFLRKDKFIEKCTSTYNDSNVNSKQKYKQNCDFERYWGLHYKKKYGKFKKGQTAWTGWLGEHLFEEYCQKNKYKYSRRPKTIAGFKIDFELISATYPLNSNQLPTKGEPGGSNPSIGLKRLTFQPYYVEVKAGAYTVEGTAHEKILGVPLKYEKIVQECPIRGTKGTKKPILILCIGAAEKFGWKYGLFNGLVPYSETNLASGETYQTSLGGLKPGNDLQETPGKILKFFNQIGFTYYPFSFLLQENGQLPILTKPSSIVAPFGSNT